MTVTNDSSMPVINPHMKFKVTETGVIKSPEVYRYSLQRDIERADDYYKHFLNSVERRNRAKFRERHPNLTGNLIGIIKACFLVFAACLGLRYRHSVPGIKNMCKPPKTPPPDFKKDFKKIFGIKL